VFSTHQIGWRALEKLAEQIISPQGHIPENILVAGNLVVRNSVRGARRHTRSQSRLIRQPRYAQ
jgi:hypothetical protein